MRAKKILGVILTGVIFGGCITTKNVSIDQLEPGRVEIPTAVRKVALLARNFKFSDDTLSNYDRLDFRLKKRSFNTNKSIDSISVTRSLDELRKALIKSGRFDEVYVYPYHTISPYVGEKQMPLSDGFIRSICQESQTEALVSLEMLSSFYSRHRALSGSSAVPGANVKVTAIWSVYMPDSLKAIDRYTHSENIKWRANDPYNPEEQYELPEAKAAISIACKKAAQKYSNRIVPYWTKSSRSLVGKNQTDWNRAFTYAENNEWESAAEIWKKYTENTNQRIAGMAALNYAIAQEMLDDLDQASVWSDNSIKLLTHGTAARMARDYAALLFHRILVSEQLDVLLKTDEQ